ncbi:double-strand break repair helicase AddA [Novosphingobium sp. ERN07]|uniref:double-strand break repair helicase AddA n=1 Tax=Novosphingobium sp. ERN07 TaxID=2726187 RepID=UPI0014571142|nr:double-strand break repair helicase AddA [Novosphingobium sp. ERN07]NLR72342.1 double-strand break repair helicase AddA [Novosphingobium sp. ERN07]
MSKVYPLRDNQAQAVHPQRTVWLSASAGTGKTQVLSARVLRLLLQDGVEPEQILCLTFTKAGAAEMATRVNEVLAGWVRLPEIELAAQLKAIGAPFGPETVARARSRFAAVLDCPGGGLRIETIHAFCQWLLASFPVEAGLRPGTRAMEDRDRALLVRQVLAEMLVTAQQHGDEALIDNLATLSRRMSEDQVEAFLLRCASALDLWQGNGAWQPPLRPRINRVIGLGENDGPESLAAMCADDAFDAPALRSCMEVLLDWNTANGAKMAGPIAEWLAAAPEDRARDIEVLAAALCNKDGEPKWLKNLLKIDGSYADAAERVITCIEVVRARKAQLDLADLLDTALSVGRRFALAWDAAKAREGFIDFDDQIRTAAELLTKRASADWIRFKLDRRFDHILVDEAQDTNASQWEIVLEGLVSDFFTGEGQRGPAVRTLFVVGDYKQAIFGFQGTSPENFARASHKVRAQLADVADILRDPNRELLELGLGQSFRTARPILDFVDAAIDHIGWDRLGLESKPERHVGLDIPGTVGLWRVVGDDAAEDEDAGESAGDEGAESWLSRPDRKLADQIALQVKGWIDSGFPLSKGGPKNAGPGDVMVLVRKRKELAGLIVARLHARGVPVAGVDRLRLGAPLAVKDLVAALRFAAQPLDDLNLAALLVSPLIGWSQEELLEHGYRTPDQVKGRVRLWELLRRSTHPLVAETLEKLGSLLRRADYEPPQALLHWLLVGPWDGRARLVARLGREANDPIDELLNAAMAYASANVPSLVGFLQWFDAGEGELKREAGKAEGLVRVMTVHGSKGLQAPIVILADAADDPDASPPRGLQLVEDVLGHQRKVPLPPLRKEEKAPAVLDAEAEIARTEREEHWRLLYVAMTRAEEALFIAGAKGKKRRKSGGELPEDSWYAQLEPLFDEDWRDDALWGGIRQIGGPPPFGAARLEPVAASRMALPEVLLTPVGAEPRPPRPLAPSSLREDDAPDPPAPPGPHAMLAARRGTLMHRLIERLPELTPEQRRDAGLAWLARTDDAFDAADHASMVDSALAVLSHPGWADVFGAESLAEVPLAAVVGGRVVSGTVDRLVIGADRIRIVDFKTARRPPASLRDVPVAYVRQMAAYVAALEAIHPGLPVEAALLYTHTPELFVLPGDVVAAQKLRLAGVQESLSG